jgi:hypothetical protein
MGLFNWTIKIDFETKTIKIKDADSPSAIGNLIIKEFAAKSKDAPVEIVILENKTTLNLKDGWKFDDKTVGVMKEKDNRRYRNFRTSDKVSMSSEFRRV